MAARVLANRAPETDQMVWDTLMRGIKGKVEFRKSATEQMQTNYTPFFMRHMGMTAPLYGNIGGNTLLAEPSSVREPETETPHDNGAHADSDASGKMELQGGVLTAAQGKQLIQNRLQKIQQDKAAQQQTMGGPGGPGGGPGGPGAPGGPGGPGAPVPNAVLTQGTYVPAIAALQTSVLNYARANNAQSAIGSLTQLVQTVAASGATMNATQVAELVKFSKALKATVDDTNVASTMVPVLRTQIRGSANDLARLATLLEEFDQRGTPRPTRQYALQVAMRELHTKTATEWATDVDKAVAAAEAAAAARRPGGGPPPGPPPDLFPPGPRPPRYEAPAEGALINDPTEAAFVPGVRPPTPPPPPAPPAFGADYRAPDEGRLINDPPEAVSVDDHARLKDAIEKEAAAITTHVTRDLKNDVATAKVKVTAAFKEGTPLATQKLNKEAYDLAKASYKATVQNAAQELHDRITGRSRRGVVRDGRMFRVATEADADEATRTFIVFLKQEFKFPGWVAPELPFSPPPAGRPTRAGTAAAGPRPGGAAAGEVTPPRTATVQRHDAPAGTANAPAPAPARYLFSPARGQADQGHGFYGSGLDQGEEGNADDVDLYGGAMDEYGNDTSDWMDPQLLAPGIAAADATGQLTAAQASSDYTLAENDDMAMLDAQAAADPWSRRADDAPPLTHWADDADDHDDDNEAFDFARGASQPGAAHAPAPMPAPPPARRPPATRVHAPSGVHALPAGPSALGRDTSGVATSAYGDDTTEMQGSGMAAAASSDLYGGNLDLARMHGDLVRYCDQASRQCKHDTDRVELVNAMGGSLTKLDGSRADRHKTTAAALEVAALDRLGEGVPFKDVVGCFE